MPRHQPQHATKQLSFLSLSLVLGLALPAGAQGADGGAPTPTLKALEGQVYRGETDGFVVVLSWELGGRLELYVKTPGVSSAAMLCVKSDVMAMPETVECEYGRGLTIAQTRSGLDVTLNPVLAKEVLARAGLVSRADAGASGKPTPTGPALYSLRRVSPIATEFEFNPEARYLPNSSSESGRLSGLVGKQRVVSVTQEWFDRSMGRSGFDPMSLSLSRVGRLRSRVEEKLNSRGDPSWTVASASERERLLHQRLQDDLDEAYGKQRRRQQQPKRP